jgi:transcriptional regulator with XRE-family HTH domain
VSPVDVRIQFGNAVRNRREKLGVSQQEFADMCELDRTYVGGVERGEPSRRGINSPLGVRYLSFASCRDATAPLNNGKIPRMSETITSTRSGSTTLRESFWKSAPGPQIHLRRRFAAPHQ